MKATIIYVRDGRPVSSDTIQNFTPLELREIVSNGVNFLNGNRDKNVTYQYLLLLRVEILAELVVTGRTSKGDYFGRAIHITIQQDPPKKNFIQRLLGRLK